MGVERNEGVDKAAKELAEKPGTRRCQERFISLAYVRHRISGRKWKETKYLFRVENDRRPPLNRTLYDPVLESQHSDIEAISTPALVSGRYYQLKSGHAVTGM